MQAYEIASTWLPEPLARHTVRDCDLTAGFAAAPTSRLTADRGPRMADTGRDVAPFLTPLPTPPPMSDPFGGETGPGGAGRSSRDARRTRPATDRKKAVAIGGGIAVVLAAVVAGATMMSSKGHTSSGAALQNGASGKGGADIAGTTGSPRPGDVMLGASAVPSAAGGATVAGAPSWVANRSSAGATAGAPQPRSSTGPSAIRLSGSAASQSSAGAPPMGATSSKPASGPATTSPAAVPAPVPCSGTVTTSSGTGYNCPFDTPGDGSTGGSPVLKSDGSVSGYLHQGTNWVLCQAQGRTQHQGQYYNDWWPWTQSDHGGWGWVNAVSAAGGDNDGAFGGVPACNGAHGAPPQ